MSYTQKKAFVIFFLCVILIISIYTNISGKVSSYIARAAFSKNETCLQTTFTFTYNKKQQLIYYPVTSFTETPLHIHQNKQQLVAFYVANNLQKYYSYFIDELAENDIFYFEKKCNYHEKSFFFLTMLETKHTLFAPVFIDNDGYYIRRDYSYVCNEDLAQNTTTFTCHQESYYIALSDIMW